MSTEKSKVIWAICPVQDCNFALEHDPDESYYCPTCEMEMITKCPGCKEPITAEEAQICDSCGGSVKD
jgi:predicted RNA-binding Zn-ribbon protein involved in translation (DUF1610 family)